MTPRQIVLILITALMLLDIIISLYGWKQLSDFLKSHPLLASSLDFEKFKRVVKSDMYLALLLIILKPLILITFIIGMFIAKFWLPEVIVISLISRSLHIFIGKKLKPLEHKMKNMLLEEDIHQEEYDQIITNWTKDPFPNW